jgi:hypothetical protein
MADVHITEDAAPVGQAEWQGWLVVNGRLDWQGHTRAEGLVYAQNDISWSGTETIRGAIVSRNIRNTASATIDSGPSGTATIIYDCAAARDGAGTIPRGWFLKAGSYREPSD